MNSKQDAWGPRPLLGATRETAGPIVPPVPSGKRADASIGLVRAEAGNGYNSPQHAYSMGLYVFVLKSAAGVVGPNALGSRAHRKPNGLGRRRAVVVVGTVATLLRAQEFSRLE